MKFRMRGLWAYPISSQLAALRLIRRQNGVGRPPAVNRRRALDRQYNQALNPGKVGPAARRRARWLWIALGREYPEKAA